MFQLKALPRTVEPAEMMSPAPDAVTSDQMSCPGVLSPRRSSCPRSTSRAHHPKHDRGDHGKGDLD